MPTLGFLLSMSNIITLNRAVSRPVINQSLELFYFSSFPLLFFFCHLSFCSNGQHIPKTYTFY